MKILGIDPSLRNFGFAMASLNTDSDSLVLTDVQLCETEASTNGKQVRKNSDDLDRCRKLHDFLHAKLKGVQVVFVEVPVGSQSARAMASYGFCVGILASIKQPTIQLTPSEVKMASVGNKQASKDEMIEWATSLYPHLPWLKARGARPWAAKNEHMADAVASIHAGLLTQEFLAAKEMMKWAMAS